MNLNELKTMLLEDGVIDTNEVELLQKELYSDGIIDSDEANFLFEINDAVSGMDNSIEWEHFFIKAISDYLLNDISSPNVIDNEETTWLLEKIGQDGKIDHTEKELLLTLRARVNSFPQELEKLLS